ncbi:MAG: 3-phosphoshikimate 1-carboxyvinyltransferase [Gemmatimonadetes bacterium]|nr:3-phosphoshikimate 1-carboxyvinyltransferase [Gemmatimonadota bacterium]
MIVTVPGDKSITQRALILSALAEGRSRLRGLLPGADPASTAGAVRALGAGIPALPPDGAEIVVHGRGLNGLAAPTALLDLGNSGTGTRLLMGVLAAQPFRAVLTGDGSLRSRPMGRVTRPLRDMGARFRHLEQDDRLPLEIEGGALRPFSYDLPVASAQVKSALLLAGLAGRVPVTLTEPGRSRDHTERMLSALGAPVRSEPDGDRWRVRLDAPPERIWPLDLDVPGDLSSAAFLIVLALLGGTTGLLTVRGIGLNPTRTGALPVLERMGAKLRIDAEPEQGGEPVGAITAAPTALTATTIDERDVVLAIDEVPILAAAGARAQGVTRITGAGELRVKETDRIKALVDNLRAVGARVEELADGLEVEGSDHPLEGEVDSFDDHRIAMAFGVLGALPGNRIRVRGRECVDVSFPGFWEQLARLSGR